MIFYAQIVPIGHFKLDAYAINFNILSINFLLTFINNFQLEQHFMTNLKTFLMMMLYELICVLINQIYLFSF